jgi:hypothetical protein
MAMTTTTRPGGHGGLILGRCNPYGAETGGPRHVLGGLHGPASARTPGQGLPDNVAQGEWSCTQPAVVRCRMTCQHGHVGQVMQLCSWHDEDTWATQMVAGTARRVKGTTRVRGHYEEITRRQAGFCPPCAFPGDFAALYKEHAALSSHLGMLQQAGLTRTPQFRAAYTRIEAIGVQFDEAAAQGIVHRCPLILVPVS